MLLERSDLLSCAALHEPKRRRFKDLMTRSMPWAAADAGGSGDADSSEIRHEFADVTAVVDAAAEASRAPVDVLGHSYGGICALEATRLSKNVRQLVLYEPPVMLDPTAPPWWTASTRSS